VRPRSVRGPLPSDEIYCQLSVNCKQAPAPRRQVIFKVPRQHTENAETFPQTCSIIYNSLVDTIYSLTVLRGVSKVGCSVLQNSVFRTALHVCDLA